MRFQIRFVNQLVGIFVIGGVILAAGAIVLLGTRQGWFEARHPFNTELESARGLTVGMPIEFRGFDVGRVTGYELNAENTVDVDFVIFDRFVDIVTEGSLVEFSSNPLFGGSMVLHPGHDSAEQLAAGSMLPEWSSELGQSIRERELVRRSEPPDAISRLLHDINPVLNRVEAVLVSTDRILGTVDGTLTGDLDAGPLAEAFEGSNRLIEEAGRRLAETESLLAETEALLASIRPMVEDASAFTAELRRPEGIIPRLIGPHGSLATLFDDDDRLFTQVEAMLISLNDTMEELNELTRYFGRQAPQLAGLLEEGRDALAVGQDVLIGLRNNPLLRRGIPERPEPQGGFESLREAEF